MAQFALLIGTVGDKRELLADGSPPDVRRLFKESDGTGYDLLEVIESGTGRSRRKKGAGPSAPVEGAPRKPRKNPLLG